MASLIDVTSDAPPGEAGKEPTQNAEPENKEIRFPVDDTPAPKEQSGGEERSEEEKEPPKFKVKVSGEEKEVPLTDLERAYQRVGGVEKRLEELRTREAQFQELLDTFQNNPLYQAIANGQDPYQVAEQLVYQRMMEERLPPEQRAVVEAQRKLAEYTQQLDAIQTQRQALLNEQKANELTSYYEPIFNKEMEKHGIPPTSHLAVVIADRFVEEARNYGWENVNPADIVETCLSDYVQLMAKSFSNVDVTKLLEWMGEENALKISRAYATKLSGKGFRPKHLAPLKPHESSQEENPVVSEVEFSEFLKKWKKT